MRKIIEQIENKLEICLTGISKSTSSDTDMKEAAAVESLTKALLNCYEIKKREGGR